MPVPCAIRCQGAVVGATVVVGASVVLGTSDDVGATDFGESLAGGFDVVARYGDFDSDLPVDAADAWRMILVLRRT